jgi:hypothetical protein
MGKVGCDKEPRISCVVEIRPRQLPQKDSGEILEGSVVGEWDIVTHCGVDELRLCARKGGTRSRWVRVVTGIDWVG